MSSHSISLNRRRWSVRLLGLVTATATAVSVLLTGPPTADAGTVSGSAVMWGMDDGTNFDSTEAALGRKFAIVREYRRLDQAFVSSRMQTLASGGRSLMISVKTRNATNYLPYSSITNGTYDAAFLAGFAAMNALPTPTYFALNHEADSSAAKNSCVNQADSACGPEFVAAWRHIHNLAVSHGYTKIRWAWTVTSYGFNPQTGIRNKYYWPGSAYTDWVGVDAYNGGCNGSWYGTFAEMMDYSLDWIAVNAPAKPVMMPEYGAVEGSTPTAKANFMNGIPAALAGPRFANVKAIMYWNVQQTDCDFRINSSAASYDAYKAVGMHPIVAAKASDPVVLGTWIPSIATPSPSASPTASPTASASPSPSTSPTVKVSPSPSATATASPSPGPTTTTSPSPSATATTSPTAEPTTPAPSSSATASPSPTAEPTVTPAPTPAPAPAPSPTKGSGTKKGKKFVPVSFTAASFTTDTVKMTAEMPAAQEDAVVKFYRVKKNGDLVYCGKDRANDNGNAHLKKKYRDKSGKVYKFLSVVYPATSNRVKTTSDRDKARID